jgi:hypothetical protein
LLLQAQSRGVVEGAELEYGDQVICPDYSHSHG